MTGRTSAASRASVTTELPRRFRARLDEIAGAENVVTDPAERWVYGYDNSRRHHPPDAVVYATSHEQVAGIVRACNEHEVALVARGRGANTTGAPLPPPPPS